MLFEARRYTDYLSSGIKTLSSRPDGEETAQATLLNSFEPALLQQVSIYLKHKRNSELFACPCSPQGQQVKSFVNQVIALQVDGTGLRHAVAIEHSQVGELQFGLNATDAALEHLKWGSSTPSQLAIVTGGPLIALEYLQIGCEENLSSLQGKE